MIFVFKLTDLLNRVMSIFVGNRQRRLFNSVAGQIEISKKYFRNYFIIKARGFHYLLGFFCFPVNFNKLNENSENNKTKSDERRDGDVFVKQYFTENQRQKRSEIGYV